MTTATTRPLTLALILLAVLSRRAAADFCNATAAECDFRLGFTNRVQTFEMRPNSTDMAITSRIRSKTSGRRIGLVSSNGAIPDFVFEKAAFPITYFGAPPYSPMHFKPFSIGNEGSAIGHQTFTGNQYEFARFRCVRMFFTSFQVLDGKGNVEKHENNVPLSRAKCVVFRII